MQGLAGVTILGFGFRARDLGLGSWGSWILVAALCPGVQIQGACGIATFPWVHYLW